MPSVDRDTFDALHRELGSDLRQVASRFSFRHGLNWNPAAYQRQASYRGETAREFLNFGMDLHTGSDGDDGEARPLPLPFHREGRFVTRAVGVIAASILILVGLSMTVADDSASASHLAGAYIQQDTVHSVTGTTELIPDAAG